MAVADAAVGGPRSRRRVPIRRVAVLAVLAGSAVPLAGSPAAPARTFAAGGDPAVVGAFEPAFEPPGPMCVPDPNTNLKVCKPAAATMVALADGRVLYWNGIEGEENVAFNTVAEAGDVAQNDQSKVVDFRHINGAPTTFVDTGNGGATSTHHYLIPGVTDAGGDPNTQNDGGLFCSNQVQLADGRILDTGGTSWYDEPQVPGTRYGLIELQGLKATRIFDPATNTWSQTGYMNYGRWYPGVVTLPNGNIFVASGVTKLIKPVYLDNVNDTGRNVQETETYNIGTGKWSYNGTSADKSLPLFPRLHLLPDGHVLYDAGGQTFNPFGQAYDEALWNMVSAYNPATRTWTDLGIPAPVSTMPGFRGDGFSVMLPLTAPYTKVHILDAGGVIGTSPGTYLGSADSNIHTIDTAGGTDTLSTKKTGSLNQGRWYTSGVLLPDGSVMAFSGANADEVDAPGTEMAITQAERFDPNTQTWSRMASASHQRTYHNSATLLPTGQVLVGGHAPISTGYAYQQTIPGFAPAQRDPSFEIYDPPYMTASDRPSIVEVQNELDYGDGTFMVTLRSYADAVNVASKGRIVIQRYGATTHLIDGDARQVVLPVVGLEGTSGTIIVKDPPNAAVAPAGPYMLFADRKDGANLIPSVASTVFVGHSEPGWVSAAQSPPPPPPPSESAQPIPGPIIPAPPQLPDPLASSTHAAATTSFADAWIRARSIVAHL